MQHGCVSLLANHKKKALVWDSSNSTQARTEEAFPQSCVCFQDICIYFIICSYHKQSQVGTVVSASESTGGTQRWRGYFCPKSYVIKTKALKIALSKPPIVIECKTHMQTQIHVQPHFFSPFLFCLPPLSQYTSTNSQIQTHTCTMQSR